MATNKGDQTGAGCTGPVHGSQSLTCASPHLSQLQKKKTPPSKIISSVLVKKEIDRDKVGGDSKDYAVTPSASHPISFSILTPKPKRGRKKGSRNIPRNGPPVELLPKPDGKPVKKKSNFDLKAGERKLQSSTPLIGLATVRNSCPSSTLPLPPKPKRGSRNIPRNGPPVKLLPKPDGKPVKKKSNFDLKAGERKLLPSTPLTLFGLATVRNSCPFLTPPPLTNASGFQVNLSNNVIFPNINRQQMFSIPTTLTHSSAPTTSAMSTINSQDFNPKIDQVFYASTGVRKDLTGQLEKVTLPLPAPVSNVLINTDTADEPKTDTNSEASLQICHLGQNKSNLDCIPQVLQNPIASQIPSAPVLSPYGSSQILNIVPPTPALVPSQTNLPVLQPMPFMNNGSLPVQAPLPMILQPPLGTSNPLILSAPVQAIPSSVPVQISMPVSVNVTNLSSNNTLPGTSPGPSLTASIPNSASQLDSVNAVSMCNKLFIPQQSVLQSSQTTVATATSSSSTIVTSSPGTRKEMKTKIRKQIRTNTTQALKSTPQNSSGRKFCSSLTSNVPLLPDNAYIILPVQNSPTPGISEQKQVLVAPPCRSSIHPLPFNEKSVQQNPSNTTQPVISLLKKLKSIKPKTCHTNEGNKSSNDKIDKHEGKGKHEKADGKMTQIPRQTDVNINVNCSAITKSCKKIDLSTQASNFLTVVFLRTFAQCLGSDMATVENYKSFIPHCSELSTTPTTVLNNSSYRPSMGLQLLFTESGDDSTLKENTGLDVRSDVKSGKLSHKICNEGGGQILEVLPYEEKEEENVSKGNKSARLKGKGLNKKKDSVLKIEELSSEIKEKVSNEKTVIDSNEIEEAVSIGQKEHSSHGKVPLTLSFSGNMNLLDQALIKCFVPLARLSVSPNEIQSYMKYYKRKQPCGSQTFSPTANKKQKIGLDYNFVPGEGQQEIHERKNLMRTKMKEEILTSESDYVDFVVERSQSNNQSQANKEIQEDVKMKSNSISTTFLSSETTFEEEGDESEALKEQISTKVIGDLTVNGQVIENCDMELNENFVRRSTRIKRQPQVNYVDSNGDLLDEDMEDQRWQSYDTEKSSEQDEGPKLSLGSLLRNLNPRNSTPVGAENKKDNDHNTTEKIVPLEIDREINHNSVASFSSLLGQLKSLQTTGTDGNNKNKKKQEMGSQMSTLLITEQPQENLHSYNNSSIIGNDEKSIEQPGKTNKSFRSLFQNLKSVKALNDNRGEELAEKELNFQVSPKPNLSTKFHVEVSNGNDKSIESKKSLTSLNVDLSSKTNVEISDSNDKSSGQPIMSLFGKLKVLKQNENKAIDEVSASNEKSTENVFSLQTSPNMNLPSKVNYKNSDNKMSMERKSGNLTPKLNPPDKALGTVSMSNEKPAEKDPENPTIIVNPSDKANDQVSDSAEKISKQPVLDLFGMLKVLKQNVTETSNEVSDINDKAVGKEINIQTSSKVNIRGKINGKVSDSNEKTSKQPVQDLFGMFKTLHQHADEADNEISPSICESSENIPVLQTQLKKNGPSKANDIPCIVSGSNEKPFEKESGLPIVAEVIPSDKVLEVLDNNEKIVEIEPDVLITSVVNMPSKVTHTSKHLKDLFGMLKVLKQDVNEQARTPCVQVSSTMEVKQPDRIRIADDGEYAKRCQKAKESLDSLFVKLTPIELDICKNAMKSDISVCRNGKETSSFQKLIRDDLVEGHVKVANASTGYRMPPENTKGSLSMSLLGGLMSTKSNSDKNNEDHIIPSLRTARKVNEKLEFDGCIVADDRFEDDIDVRDESEGMSFKTEVCIEDDIVEGEDELGGISSKIEGCSKDGIDIEGKDKSGGMTLKTDVCSMDDIVGDESEEMVVKTENCFEDDMAINFGEESEGISLNGEDHFEENENAVVGLSLKPGRSSWRGLKRKRKHSVSIAELSQTDMDRINEISQIKVNSIFHVEQKTPNASQPQGISSIMPEQCDYYYSSESDTDLFDDLEDKLRYVHQNKVSKMNLLMKRHNDVTIYLIRNSNKFSTVQEFNQTVHICDVCNYFRTDGVYRLFKHLKEAHKLQ